MNDYNGHRIKPGHDGEPRGHATGPYPDSTVWLLARDDDKLYGYWPNCLAAVSALATADVFSRTQSTDWFEPVAVPAQSVREADVIEVTA